MYSLKPYAGTWTGAPLYSFCSAGGCADGEFPIGELGLDAGGNLYGTTAGGGDASGNGVAYRVATASGTETVLHTFCSAANCEDGNDPLAGSRWEIRDELFGAAIVGGKHNGGVVYRLHATSGKEKVLYAFCRKANCAEGPSSPVVQDAGTLVGTAGGGDAASDGLVYRIGVSNDETILYTFCQKAGCTDGAAPVGVIPSRHALFGVTQRGGDRNDGVVFELRQ